MPSVEAGPASVDARRKRGRRVFLAAMFVSVAFHALVLSREVSPPDPPRVRAATAPAPSDHRSAIRLSRILVAEPDIRPESREPVTDEVVAEPEELEPEDQAPTPTPEPVDPSPTLEPERPRPARTGAADALRAGIGNPLLWRNFRDISPSAGSGRIVLSGRGADGRVSGPTPADFWAFDTWTTRDGDGRLWGAAPGVIHLAGIAIPFCGGRFDASDCGFGLPPWRRGEYRFFLRALNEIERQAQRAVIRERARAMRERREGRGR